MTPTAAFPLTAHGRVTAWVSASAELMGGRVSVHVRPPVGTSSLASQGMARQVLARIAAWSGRLTRFDAGSELSRLNASPLHRVEIGPTLTAVLDWGRCAETMTDGVVDIGLLDARLLAESGLTDRSRPTSPASRSCSIIRHRRGAMVDRPAGLRFDLDGIAKGWIADRALDLVPGISAVVDADGDIAVRVVDDEGWDIGVADPREPGTLLATFRIARGDEPAARYGIATSGTSVHRWVRASGTQHHLIDRRTARPARTDVVQATVIGRTASAAEAYAKTAVIVGSEAATSRLDRPEVLGQILVTESGNVLMTAATVEYLA
jgi:thiamine biosynthesis lipoprotein